MRKNKHQLDSWLASDVAFIVLVLLFALFGITVVTGMLIFS